MHHVILPPTMVPPSPWEQKIQEERNRRKQTQQIRDEEQTKRSQEHRSKALMKMLDGDEDWQIKTNRPNKLPKSTPERIRTLVEGGDTAFDHGDYQGALKKYSAALSMRSCIHTPTPFAMRICTTSKRR